MAIGGVLYFEEVDGQRRGVHMRGSTAPHGGRRKDSAFSLGGTLRSTRSYEPGQTRPVRQIMGSAERDLEVHGHLRDGLLDEQGGAAAARETIDAIRQDGRELRIVWMDLVRRGFLVDAEFPVESGSDFLYKLKFEIDDVGDDARSADFRRLRSVAAVSDLSALSDAMDTHRSAILSVPGLSFDVSSAISSLFASCSAPLFAALGALGDVENEIGEVSDAYRRITNSMDAFAARLEHLAGTLDAYGAKALDIASGAADAAWTRARSDALAALQDVLARARALGAEAEQRVTGATWRVYVMGAGDTLEAVARREGTTIESLWALNPGLPLEPPVGTRIRLP